MRWSEEGRKGWTVCVRMGIRCKERQSESWGALVVGAGDAEEPSAGREVHAAHVGAHLERPDAPGRPDVPQLHLVVVAPGHDAARVSYGEVDRPHAGAVLDELLHGSARGDVPDLHHAVVVGGGELGAHVRVPGDAGELAAGDDFGGGAVDGGARVRHAGVLVRLDPAGDTRGGEEVAVAREADAAHHLRQPRRRAVVHLGNLLQALQAEERAQVARKLADRAADVHAGQERADSGEALR